MEASLTTGIHHHAQGKFSEAKATLDASIDEIVDAKGDGISQPSENKSCNCWELTLQYQLVLLLLGGLLGVHHSLH